LVLNPPLLRPIAWSSPSFFVRRHYFWEFQAQKVERRSLETIGDEKSPHLAGLSYQEKEIL
jgi:hypothetical protein